MSTVNISWTGGWDSTFRMVELSRMEVTVQPVHVIDPDRGSKDFERHSMSVITDMLRNDKRTKAEILPVKYIPLSDVVENEEITRVWNVFAAVTHVGSQYDWLARLALSYPMIEVCVEKPSGPHCPIMTTVKKFGALKEYGGSYVLDQDKSTPECKTLLGNFSFPIIMKTERDMLNLILEWGYEEVMKNIWFCHSPISGKPCGFCNPCDNKMTSGMEFLLPPEAQKRNRHMQFIKKCFGEKLCRKYTQLYGYLHK